MFYKQPFVGVFFVVAYKIRSRHKKNTRHENLHIKLFKLMGSLFNSKIRYNNDNLTFLIT